MENPHAEMGDSIQLVAVDMHLDLLAKCLIRTIALKEFTPVDPPEAVLRV